MTVDQKILDQLLTELSQLEQNTAAADARMKAAEAKLEWHTARRDKLQAAIEVLREIPEEPA